MGPALGPPESYWLQMGPMNIAIKIMIIPVPVLISEGQIDWYLVKPKPNKTHTFRMDDYGLPLVL